MDILRPKMIGDINKSKILELVKNRSTSRAEMADILNISRPAVTKNVNTLIEVGLIKEGRLEDSESGRKPLLLEFNKTFGYVLGINVRSKIIQIVLADLMGNILDKEIIDIGNNDSFEVYEQIKKSIIHLIDRKEIKLEEVLSVGISSPGINDLKSGGYVLNPFIKHWNRLNLVKKLKADLDLDSVVFNDVDISVMGERLKGNAKECNDFAYLKLWDGFAARYIIGGRMHHGVNNAAGEIGFMVLDEKFLQKQLNTTGKLESIITNSGISDMYKQYASQKNICVNDKDEFDIKEIIKLKENGNAAADITINKLITYISMVIINICTVIDPELIILGGDLINVDDVFIDNIVKTINNNFPFPPKIVRAALGEESEIIGCISVALEEANKKLQMLW